MFQGPDGRSYRVADAHAHVYKQKIAAKASQAISAFYDEPMFEAEPTCERLVAYEGGVVGVDRFLIFGAATRVEQVDSINRFIAGEVAAHPQCVGAGTAHADVEDFGALVDQVEQLGLVGVKLHPDMQGFAIDDARLMPLYAEMERRGLVMIFHVGDERHDFSAPERLVRVLERFPDLRVHAAHLGCCRIFDRRPVAIADAVFTGADIAFDTSSAIAWIPVDTARYIIDLLGPERIMWGTDTPMGTPLRELEHLFALGYSPEQTAAMLYDNFARFYRIA